MTLRGMPTSSRICARMPLERWTIFSRHEGSSIQIPRIRRTPELRFRVLLTGDAEAEEEYEARDRYTGSLIVINVPKLHTL
jgi:hypothetical protein